MMYTIPELVLAIRSTTYRPTLVYLTASMTGRTGSVRSKVHLWQYLTRLMHVPHTAQLTIKDVSKFARSEFWIDEEGDVRLATG